MNLTLCGGTVFCPQGPAKADIVIRDGVIEEVCADAGGNGEDVGGFLILPGIVDAHVHFNEPGRTHWEGFETGSLALAAGGGTSFADMPLNSSPPTIDRAGFLLKRAAGEASSRLDFALWGGLVPDNTGRMDELAECGVVGFKAFMVDSGIEDFPGVNPAQLKEGMKVAASHALPVAVHAENPEILSACREQLLRSGSRNAETYLQSRPVASEIEAIRIALDVAGETGCQLHVVHVSAPEALVFIDEARRRGANVTAEVCPHYLLLNGSDMAVHKAHAKCAPPLRDEYQRLGMWDCLASGLVTTIGSDHSPSPPEMKETEDLFAAWGGIMGCQHGFGLVMDGPADLASLVPLMTANPARLLGLEGRKGRIAPGYDADLVLWRKGPAHEIRVEDLLYRHKTSPYVGRQAMMTVERTYRRGEIVYENGRTLPATPGKFLSRRK